MSTPKILVEAHGPVTTIIINRPQARNALDNEAAHGLADALRAFEADPEARVAVLTGAGGAFCAGAISRSWARARITFHGPAATKGRCVHLSPSR